MPRRFVDLSIYLENDVISDPPGFRPRIEYVDHTQSLPQLTGLKREVFPLAWLWR